MRIKRAFWGSRLFGEAPTWGSFRESLQLYMDYYVGDLAICWGRVALPAVRPGIRIYRVPSDTGFKIF